MLELSKEKLKELKKLHLKKYRDERQEVLVEGSRTIRQLITDGIRLNTVYCLEGSLDSYRDIFNHLPADRVFRVKEHQLSQLAVARTAQDIIALTEKRVPVFGDYNRLVYIDRISDPGNLGAIFRTAKATGMDGIILSPDTADIFNPRTIRASVGTVFSLASRRGGYEILQEIGNEILITDSREGDSLFDIDMNNKAYILVIGSEATGIDDAIKKIADRKIRIPMLGNLESLNVAVAAALCMYQLNRDIISI